MALVSNSVEENILVGEISNLSISTNNEENQNEEHTQLASLNEEEEEDDDELIKQPLIEQEEPSQDPIQDISLTHKHPLHNRWTLWFDSPKKKTTQAAWLNTVKAISTFDTVEDFWGLYNNVYPPSGMGSGSNYHLFMEGVEPAWEDPANKNGGKWIYTLPNKANSKENLDKLWLFSLLAVIGEAFAEGEICGCVVSIRRAQNRLSLWTRDWRNEAVVRSIGTQFKATLELKQETIIGYQAHSDSLQRNSSFNNQNRYQV